MENCKYSFNHSFKLSKYEKSTLNYYNILDIKSKMNNKNNICINCNSKKIIPAIHSTKSRTLKAVSKYSSKCEIRFINQKEKKYECYQCKLLF